MPTSATLLRKRLAAKLAKHGAVVALARRLGVSRATVDNWIDGTSVPNLSILDALAEGLDSTPWDLLKPDDAEFSDAGPMATPTARKCADLISKMSPIGQETAIETLEAILKIDKRVTLK